MCKSVEHVLLRVLTPALLLFLAAHIVAGTLNLGAAREDAPRDRIAGYYLEGASGTVRIVRPNKLQVRKSRTLEHEANGVRPRFPELAVAYVAALLGIADRAEQPGRFVPRDAVPPLLAHARTRNPRDPPLPLA